MNNSLDNNSLKVRLCDRCRHINSLETKFCARCGNILVSGTVFDYDKALEIQRAEQPEIIKKDKAEYEFLLKKYNSKRKILFSVLAVWIILSAIMLILSNFTGEQDRYETVTVDYKTYSDDLQIGDDSKIYVSSVTESLSLTGTINGQYAGEISYYFFVETSDGNPGVIMVDRGDAESVLGYSNSLYCQTYYGKIVRSPAEAKNHYDSEIKEMFSKYPVLMVDPDYETEREILVEAEDDVFDKISWALNSLLPIMIVLFVLLIKLKRPRRFFND